MNNQKPKIIFMGTPNFAKVILEALIQAKFPILAIVTEPDSQAGRGQQASIPPIKILAQKNKIPVLQPASLIKDKTIIQKLQKLQPDLIIVAAYGKIIPQAILDIPKYKSINVHGSLLPKYRGASPVVAAILAGEQETGVTIMLMDAKMDHGPILSQAKLPIDPADTTVTLLNKMAKLGAKTLIKTIPEYLSGKIKSKPQNHQNATFVKMIAKDNGQIDWQKSADQIDRQIRAYFPWPGAFTFWQNKRLKINQAQVISLLEPTKPGTCFKAVTGDLAIAGGVDALLIQKIQLEGKKEVFGKDFINGYPQIVGENLKHN